MTPPAPGRSPAMARFAQLVRFSTADTRGGDSRSATVGNPLPDLTGSKGGAGDGEFLALHAEREGVERALALAQARQRFSQDPAEAERAKAEEADLLARLDTLMTRIRAAEYRRRPGARRW